MVAGPSESFANLVSPLRAGVDGIGLRLAAVERGLAPACGGGWVPYGPWADYQRLAPVCGGGWTMTRASHQQPAARPCVRGWMDPRGSLAALSAGSPLCAGVDGKQDSPVRLCVRGWMGSAAPAGVDGLYPLCDHSVFGLA